MTVGMDRKGGGTLEAIDQTAHWLFSVAALPSPDPSGSLCPVLFSRRLTPVGCTIQATFRSASS